VLLRLIKASHHLVDKVDLELDDLLLFWSDLKIWWFVIVLKLVIWKLSGKRNNNFRASLYSVIKLRTLIFHQIGRDLGFSSHHVWLESWLWDTFFKKYRFFTPLTFFIINRLLQIKTWFFFRSIFMVCWLSCCVLTTWHFGSEKKCGTFSIVIIFVQIGCSSSNFVNKKLALLE
jgi:hypothetical protein